MCKNSVLESESVSQRIVIYRTRQFMGNWQIFRKFTNIKYANINKKGERQMDIQTKTERQSQRQTEAKREREMDKLKNYFLQNVKIISAKMNRLLVTWLNYIQYTGSISEFKP